MAVQNRAGLVLKPQRVSRAAMHLQSGTSITADGRVNSPGYLGVRRLSA